MKLFSYKLSQIHLVLIIAGFLGIGIKDSIASADELVVAINKQKKSITQSKKKVEHINQI